MHVMYPVPYESVFHVNWITGNMLTCGGMIEQFQSMQVVT